MNLFTPVPNANEKQQFCQIVKILAFNICRKRWYMRKNSQKTLKKNTEKCRELGEKGGGTKKTKKRFFSFDHVAGHLLQQACMHRYTWPCGATQGGRLHAFCSEVSEFVFPKPRILHTGCGQ